MAAQHTLIDLVEAIWAFERPELVRDASRWLEHIVRETDKHLGDGAGTHGFMIDLRRTDGNHLYSPVLYGGEPHWQEVGVKPGGNP